MAEIDRLSTIRSCVQEGRCWIQAASPAADADNAKEKRKSTEELVPLMPRKKQAKDKNIPVHAIFDKREHFVITVLTPGTKTKQELELDIYVAENDKGLRIRGQFAENLVEGELISGNGNMPTGLFEFDVAFPSCIDTAVAADVNVSCGLTTIMLKKKNKDVKELAIA
ncbi:9062_t:CDS:2 [Paraglomus occultum]|uniref:9062_t:CDS:1 n=1 Tax=Paraglomus occultum TaxID=144539 RepID=A0A9N8ZZD6_9GLOM|nr:9062_t:CDS:2 [Paraglomus occultum]